MLNSGALLRGSGGNSLGGGGVEEVLWAVQEKGTIITHAYVKI
jgi:hypothetical protein